MSQERKELIDRAQLLNGDSGLGQVKETDKAVLLSNGTCVGWVAKSTITKLASDDTNVFVSNVSNMINKKGATIDNFIAYGTTSSNVAAKFLNTADAPTEHEKTVSFPLKLKDGTTKAQHIPKSAILKKGSKITESGETFYFLVNKNIADKLKGTILNSTNTTINDKVEYASTSATDTKKDMVKSTERQTLLDSSPTITDTIKKVKETEKGMLLVNDSHIGWVAKSTIDKVFEQESDITSHDLSVQITKQGATIDDFLMYGTTSNKIASQYLNVNTKPTENEKTFSITLEMHDGTAKEQHIPKSAVLHTGMNNDGKHYLLINKGMAKKLTETIALSKNAKLNPEITYFKIQKQDTAVQEAQSATTEQSKSQKNVAKKAEGQTVSI